MRIRTDQEVDLERPVLAVLEGHESVEPLFLGFFIGERALVARTELNQTPGIAVTDGLEIVWHPTAGRSRPLGPIEVYCLYKGRKILRTFNV